MLTFYADMKNKFLNNFVIETLQWTVIGSEKLKMLIHIHIWS